MRLPAHGRTLNDLIFIETIGKVEAVKISETCGEIIIFVASKICLKPNRKFNKNARLGDPIVCFETPVSISYPVQRLQSDESQNF